MTENSSTEGGSGDADPGGNVDVGRLEDRLDEQSDTIARHARDRAELKQRVTELEEMVDFLQDRLAAVEARSDPDLKDYEDMDRQEKLGKLREHLIGLADDRPNNRAAVDYSAVVSLFDGHPSAGTAYNLMEQAGEEPGFEYEEREGEKNRLTCDADRVKTERGFSALNKTSEGVTP